MNKIFLVLFILFSFSGLAKIKNPSELKYGQNVEIKSGFYQGLQGRVVSITDIGWRADPKDRRYLITILINSNFETGRTVQVTDENLLLRY